MPARIEIWTRCPRPVCVRWYSAAQIAPNRWMRVARVADLGAGRDRRAVLEAGRAHRAAGRLGDVSYALQSSSAPGPKPLSDA